ncbi:hypothetical protein, partial [Paenibacillus xylanexedens]|uniref:hypothetical protein n=1 Tax=Paenibacillus xylanexedens TaxID=528191 RepID=UPI00119F6C3E
MKRQLGWRVRESGDVMDGSMDEEGMSKINAGMKGEVEGVREGKGKEVKRGVVILSYLWYGREGWRGV